MDFVRPVRAIPVSLVGGRGHYETVISAVLEARRSVWIATANLKELMVEDPSVPLGPTRTSRHRYRSVLEIFDRLARAGVELRLLHAAYPSRAFREEFDAHPGLVRGGLELRMCPRVHFKTVIVDAAFVYLGSANWTGAGLGAKGEHRRNFELGFVSSDESTIDEVQTMYEAVWTGDHCATCKVRDVCEAPLDLP